MKIWQKLIKTDQTGKTKKKRKEEEERTKTGGRWIDIGERVKAWYRETTKVWDAQTVDIGGVDYPVGAGKSKTADWGMSLAKKAGEAGEEVYDV